MINNGISESTFITWCCETAIVMGKLGVPITIENLIEHVMKPVAGVTDRATVTTAEEVVRRLRALPEN